MGVLEYHVFCDPHDANLFVFYAADLREHLAKPYIAVFPRGRLTYLEADLNIHWIAMVSPRCKAGQREFPAGER
jgi:hypothetical protein